jgi:hypothetical protein
MSNCLSPACGGSVLAETMTDGLCGWCGLHHRRVNGVLTWDRIIGPVVVTLFGSAGEARTASGYEQTIDADAVRFKDGLTIDTARGATTFRAIVPRSRLVRIVARD